MKATEIIRNILDIIDSIESSTRSSVEIEKSDNKSENDKFIDLMKDLTDTHDNNPKPIVMPIDVVTTKAGGGLNGPKNPRDLRGNSFPIYPENT